MQNICFVHSFQTYEEFSKIYLQGLRVPEVTNKTRRLPPRAVDALPQTVNWKTKGVVTPVKNQVQCILEQ